TATVKKSALFARNADCGSSSFVWTLFRKRRAKGQSIFICGDRNHQSSIVGTRTMAARLKILIITGIFPPDIGGPATYVPAMGNELAKRGHRVTVVTLSDATQNPEHRYLFSVARIPRRTFKLLRVLLAMAVILREGRGVDVLLVNGL